MTSTDTAQTEGPSGYREAVELEFDAATKRYPGAEQPAVDALTLTVPAGEICVLVGPSGCGKTTAMRMVNRMTDITSGDIRVGGRSVRDRNADDLRREIGYVIQQVGLFPHRTIADNIATVPRLLGWDKRRVTARVAELLDLISLPEEMGSRYPAQLSGGQRQRVGVARALAADPPLMLMDEPFGAIDPINRERLQNEFLRLQAEIRKTVVFVTHDIDEAIKVGDRIAILREGGHLEQYAPPAELLMSPASPFVEDFVGADRALKRLSLQKVRDVDLWQAPLVREGDPVADVRRRLEAADVRIPLLVDERGAPLGWLSERGLAGDTVAAELRSGPEPVLDVEDVLRDALSDLLAHESRYGPVVNGSGAVVGVLSIELLSQMIAAEEAGVIVLAQLQIHERTGKADCVERNGICPRWIVDNFDRYTHPFLQQLVLVLLSVAIGFAIAFSLGLLAHRRRHLIAPITQVTGVLYTLPSVAVFFLLLPITGRGTVTALIALVAYSLLIIFRNVITGLEGVPEEARDAGRGMGLTPHQLLWRVELPLAVPEIMAGLRIALTTTVGLASLAFLAGAGGLGDTIFSDRFFRSNVLVAGGLCVLMAVAFDLAVLGVQKILTPWTRAAAS